MSANVKFFAGTASYELASRIAGAYGAKLGNVDILRFSDGEFQPSFEETVRGAHVFIIQSTHQPTDNLFELLLMVDAARRASAYKITAVMPYFGFARQDRKDKPRVPIGAKLVANLLSAAGVDRVLTMDLHADQIQGFFEVPVDHLFSSALMLPHIQSLGLPNLMIATPDTGGAKRASTYAKFLDVDLAICYKQRKKANVVDKMTVVGNVKGKDVVLIDDMVDTAGTLTKAADMLIEEGATSVSAVCTHGVLSGDAFEKLERSKMTKLYVTDSIPLSKQSDKIEVIGVAEMFANVINNVVNQESISSNFIV